MYFAQIVYSFIVSAVTDYQKYLKHLVNKYIIIMPLYGSSLCHAAQTSNSTQQTNDRWDGAHYLRNATAVINFTQVEMLMTLVHDVIPTQAGSLDEG